MIEIDELVASKAEIDFRPQRYIDCVQNILGITPAPSESAIRFMARIDSLAPKEISALMQTHGISLADGGTGLMVNI